MGAQRKYNDTSVKKILAEANKSPVLAVCKKYAISPSSFYKWAKRRGFVNLYKGSFFRNAKG